MRCGTIFKFSHGDRSASLNTASAVKHEVQCHTRVAPSVAGICDAGGPLLHVDCPRRSVDATCEVAERTKLLPQMTRESSVQEMAGWFEGLGQRSTRAREHILLL